MIARRLRDKSVRGEPITIENFVIDMVIKLLLLSKYVQYTDTIRHG